MAGPCGSPSRRSRTRPLRRTDVAPRFERGQGVVEYGLILGGSALVAGVTLVALGPVLGVVIDFIVGLIEAATQQH